MSQPASVWVELFTLSSKLTEQPYFSITAVQFSFPSALISLTLVFHLLDGSQLESLFLRSHMGQPGCREAAAELRNMAAPVGVISPLISLIWLVSCVSLQFPPSRYLTLKFKLSY